jgi:hypothetical protein
MPHQVLNASLALFEEVGQLVAQHRGALFLEKPYDPNETIRTLGDIVYNLGWLLLCANEGSSLDESSLEMTFSWDIIPAEDVEFVPVLTLLAHIVNKNLQNVIGSGVLERTSFYPGFRYAACLAKTVNLKLSEVAKMKDERLRIRFPTAFDA